MGAEQAVRKILHQEPEAQFEEVALGKIRELESEVEHLRSHLAFVEQQRDHFKDVVEGIVRSKSWRLTQGLRSLAQLLRTIWPPVRLGKINCSLTPQNNIEVSSDSGYATIVGPTPSFNVVTPPQIPHGWVRIGSDLICDDGKMNFLLYYRTSGGFSSSERAWVLLSSKRSEAALVRLPHGVTGLRLDPFEGGSLFKLQQLRLQPLGITQIGYELLRRHVFSVITRPAVLKNRIQKGIALLRSGGLTALRHRLLSQEERFDYHEWVKKYDTLSDKDREQIRGHLESLPYHPLISIIMPTYNTPVDVLRCAIESVRRQLYPRWELCIADDASSNPEVKTILSDYTQRDERIRVIFRDENGHISEASNSAIALARGEFIAALDHDDELTEHALYHVVRELNDNRDLVYLYSDEDKKTRSGIRFNPYFKPDWNPDLFLAQNYTTHFSVYRADAVRAVGGYRSECNGAQDWDLTLRIVDTITPDKIRHIPFILYHWRVMEGSTAQATSFKPYVLEAQQRAVADHMARRGERCEVQILRDISQLRVKFQVPEPAPAITLVMPTKDNVDVLRRCVDSLLNKTHYTNFRLIVVDNNSAQTETFRYFRSLKEDSRVSIVRDERPFNFSQLNNTAVEQVDTPLVGFLNNDLEIIDGGWLTELVSHAVREPVGAVGAKLLYPNNLIQHAGIVLGIGGVAGHNHKGRPRHDVGYFNRVALPSNFAAVTAACLVMRTTVFREVGGFDEDALAVAFNDVDLCLKVGQAGYRIVYTPYAELYHYESVSRGYENTPAKFKRFEREVAYMQERWGEFLRNDPNYSPNLTLLHEDFSFAFPPRARKPWRTA